jgi:hypothetical protein
MKNKLVLITSMLLWLGMFSSCSSDDDTPSTLWGTWSIIGYGNDEDFHTGDNIVNTTRLTFYSDGTFDGNIFPNKVSGRYKCSGNNFSFTEIFGTQLGAVDTDLQFIGIHITEVNIYKILSGSELRLYYDGDNYIKFNKER